MSTVNCKHPIPLTYRAAKAFAGMFRMKTLCLSNRIFRTFVNDKILYRDFFGFRLFLDVSRSDAQRLLYLEGERFLEERFLYERLLRPGDSVVDVGANTGYCLLFFRSIAGPAGRFICIEPEPDNLVELQRNIACNKLENVTVIPAAAGMNSGSTRILRGLNATVSQTASGNDIEVRLVKVDSVVTSPVNFIKIDVEGSEAKVITGAEETIRRWRPALFIEVHPWLLTDDMDTLYIVNFLKKYYSKIRYYEDCRHRMGFFKKILYRYTGACSTAEIRNEYELLGQCAHGRHQAIWLTAEP